MEYLRFFRLVDNCLIAEQIKVAFLGEIRVLHSNTHHFCKNGYFFHTLGYFIGQSYKH